MASDYDRIKAGLVSIIRRTLGAFIVQRVDFLAGYPSKAVAQNADGTLELVPDDARLPQYSRVPIRYGIPGVSAQVAAGARVLLEFAGADPQKPVATVWESASVTSLTFTGTAINLGQGASHKLIFGDDFSTVGGAFDTLIKAIGTAVGGIPGGGAAATAINTALTAYQTAVLAKLSNTTKTT